MDNDNKRKIKFFIIKFIWRFFHLLSVIFLFGDCSYNLFFGKRKEEDSSRIILSIVTSVILVIAGLGNMITMLFEKNYDKNNIHFKIWKYVLYFKFGVAMFLTPILDRIIKAAIVDVTNQIDIARFILMFLAYILSVFIRYFREYYAKTIDQEKMNNSDDEMVLDSRNN